jgi:GTPase SAR1 family protein
VNLDFSFYDTNGSDEYDGMRRISYADADIVLLCFAVNSTYALTNIEEKVCHLHAACASDSVITTSLTSF